MNKHLFPLLLSLTLLLSAALTGCQAVFPAKSAAATPPPVVEGSNTVTAEAHLVPRDSTWLAFTTPGDISEVLVKEGDTVTQGQVLARLGSREQAEAGLASAKLAELDAQQALDTLNRKAGMASSQAHLALIDAQNAVLVAQQKLNDLDTDSYQQQIDDAATEVQNKKDDLKTAQDDADKYKNLAKDNATRKNADTALENAQKAYDDAVRKHDDLANALEQVRTNLTLAQAKVADAQKDDDARKNGPDPDQLALVQLKLDNAKAQVTAAQAALDSMELKAPYAGTIVTVNIAANEHAVPATPVILLADVSQWYAETSDLTELDIVKIAQGDSATVTPDALKDLDLSAKVDHISDTYKEKGGDIVYTVRLQLTQTDPRLRWGMTVKVTFSK